MFLSLLAASGCRLEVRNLAGAGGRGGAGDVEAAVRRVYGALATADTAALDAAALPAATVALAGAAEGFMVPLHAFWETTGARAGQADVRIVRADVRPDDGLATARVVVAMRPPGALIESEASDVLTFVHRDGGWQLAHAALGAWHGRPAP